jgi:hypothetical protein
MLNTTVISNVEISLNILSIVGTLLTGVICMFMLGIFLQSIMKNRDTIFVLAANSCVALFVFSIGSVITYIDVLSGDFKWFVAKETFSCRFRGYALYALLGVIYNTFGLQVRFLMYSRRFYAGLLVNAEYYQSIMICCPTYFLKTNQ